MRERRLCRVATSPHRGRVFGPIVAHRISISNLEFQRSIPKCSSCLTRVNPFTACSARFTCVQSGRSAGASECFETCLPSKRERSDSSAGFSRLIGISPKRADRDSRGRCDARIGRVAVIAVVNETSRRWVSTHRRLVSHFESAYRLLLAEDSSPVVGPLRAVLAVVAGSDSLVLGVHHRLAVAPGAVVPPDDRGTG